MLEEKTTQGVQTTRFVVRAEEAGKRLDVILAERVPGLSRRRARVLISGGAVSVDGRRLLVHSRRIAAGREIACHQSDLVSARIEALDPARILYEDASLLAIDKPAGVPSHPTLARKQGTALQLAEEHLRRRAGEKVPLWPLHRLDAGTSGILLFAKSTRAARILSQGFARRRIQKLYRALVAVAPEPPEGEIALPLTEGAMRSVPSETGKDSTTRYRILQRFPKAVLLEVEPLTGRMHQIRVHLAAIGHPVLGETKYAPAAEPPLPRLFLHAGRLELPHPDGGRPLILESPTPADWFEFASGGQLQGNGGLNQGIGPSTGDRASPHRP